MPVPGPTGESPSTIDDQEQKRLIARLRRLEGQIRGLQNMIDQRRPCEEILTQVSAAKVAMNQVGLHVIAHAMKECVQTSPEASRDELVDRALDVFLKYVKCVQ